VTVTAADVADMAPVPPVEAVAATEETRDREADAAVEAEPASGPDGATTPEPAVSDPEATPIRKPRVPRKSKKKAKALAPQADALVLPPVPPLPHVAPSAEAASAPASGEAPLEPTAEVADAGGADAGGAAGGAEPDSAAPEGAEPEAAEPEAAEPEAAEPEAAAPEGAEPEGAAPEAATPDAAPEAAEPEAAEQEAAEPGVAPAPGEPADAEPSAEAPGVAAPEASEADVAEAADPEDEGQGSDLTSTALLEPVETEAAEPAYASSRGDAATGQTTALEAEPQGEIAALRLRGVSKSFGETKAVDAVDLTVRPGTFYGIVGPNGAGKTTTLSMATGLLRPDRGTIEVVGVDLGAEPARAKRLMGILPDRLRTFDRLTGRQLLHYYGVLRGLRPAVVESRIADLARAFDLTDALGRTVADYSAGMTKKVMLAGAMIHSPRILVLDEPFEAVDPVSSSVILEILKAYVAHGGTVVLSSHGMDLVESVCSGVAVIVAGQVLAEGTVDEVRGELTLEQRFIELAGGLSDVEGLEWLHTFSG